MKKYLFTALVLMFFLIAPFVAADQCLNDNILVKEFNVTGTYTNITESCSFGCDSVLHQCKAEFFIPVSFYFLFELMALTMLFGSIYFAFGKGKDETEASPIPLLPALSMILFLVLSIGTVHLFIVLINYFFGIISIFMAIYSFFMVARIEAQKGIGKKDI